MTTSSTTRTLNIINTLVLASIGYDAAKTSLLHAVATEQITKADCKLGLCMAYVHHDAKYTSQFDREAGKAVRGSALERKVHRDMKDDTTTAQDNMAKVEIEVPADILKAAAKLVAMCAEYEGAAKLLAKAVAAARAA